MLDPKNTLLEWALSHEHELDTGHPLQARSVRDRNGLQAWEFVCCDYEAA